MNRLGVIPARYGSTRFPGKPLADLGGKPIVQHVYERCRMAAFDRIVVATDDLRIEKAVRAFGGESVMTSPDAPSGTDRIVEALSVLEADGEAYHVIVNIQGDEPFIDPGALNECLSALEEDKDLGVATLAAKIVDIADLSNPNVVKVVDNFAHDALYFSRSLIPYPRDYVTEDGEIDYEQAFRQTVFFKHIGVYAYRKSALMKFVTLPPSPLEMIEKLEQLRILQSSGRIRIIETEGRSIGIDTPADLRRAESLLAGDLS